MGLDVICCRHAAGAQVAEALCAFLIKRIFQIILARSIKFLPVPLGKTLELTQRPHAVIMSCIAVFCCNKGAV